MRYAVIENSIVTNVVELDSASEWNGLVVQSDTANIGDSYDGTVIVPVAVALPTVTPQQQAAVLINGGLTITSASTPTINGTYACDNNTTAEINAEITSILLNNTFADGSSTLVWLDAEQIPHTFNSISEFKIFATAIAAFVSRCIKYASGLSATPPSNSVSVL
jgi:hypothetical protein